MIPHLVNVGLSTVSAWESGDRTPPIARLKEVASALNVNINYLLGEKEIEYCVDSVSPVNSKEDEFLWDILNRSLLLTPKQRKLTLELITLLFSKENES